MQPFRLRVDVLEIWDISVEAETESDAINAAQLMETEQIRKVGELLATDTGDADALDEDYATEIKGESRSGAELTKLGLTGGHDAG